MLNRKVLDFGKGTRRIMNNKIQACKEVLSSAQNRLIIGLVAIGLGIGLVASAFARTRH